LPPDISRDCTIAIINDEHHFSRLFFYRQSAEIKLGGYIQINATQEDFYSISDSDCL